MMCLFKQINIYIGIILFREEEKTNKKILEKTCDQW